MFTRIQYMFEMHTMKRFTDSTLVAILTKMRQPGGVALSQAEWKALEATHLDTDRLQQRPEEFCKETDGWYEASYLWSIVSMACLARAMISARQQKQILFYCQAVDCSAQIRGSDRDLYARMLAVPSLAVTSRLPCWAMVHVGMRVRLTTQVLPPWAVQDAAGTVMELDLSHTDRNRLRSDGDEHLVAEVCIKELPHGVYI